jgi:hypothetical protein
VRIEGGRGQRPATGGKVARGRRPTELVAERPELLEKLLARQEPPREEPGSPLGGIPRPEVLDHGLRMDARLGILRELAHRGRATSPLGGGPELRENLLIGVSPAQAGAEGRELVLVDPHRSAL